MQAIEIFSLANQYHLEGNYVMAIDLWNKSLQDPTFSLSYLNLANEYLRSGNAQKALECYVNFKRRPLTGETIDMLPMVNGKIQEIQKQLTPQPAQVK